MARPFADGLKNEALSEALLGRIPQWREDPERYVREVFLAVPQKWQQLALRSVAENQRTAQLAAKGVGKSTILSWSGWWFLTCYQDANVFTASITEQNLAKGLWKELGVWYNKGPDWLRKMFSYENKNIKSKTRPLNHFISQVTWPKAASVEQQVQAFAGLHADNIMALGDETGEWPGPVLDSLEAILSAPMARLVIAGNCSSRQGALYQAKQRPLDWNCLSISADPADPDRSDRVPVELAQKVIDQYGRDHPITMINILGIFPKSELTGLLGPEDVEKSVARFINEDDVVRYVPYVGIDVSRGGIDSTVMIGRRGTKGFPAMKFSDARGDEIYKEFVDYCEEHFPDVAPEDVRVFVDGTGGYAISIEEYFGHQGMDIVSVPFQSRARDKERYANVRAEIWFEGSEWVKGKGKFSAEEDTLREFTEEVSDAKGIYQGDTKFILEPKENIKSRIGRSPDTADAFFLTFTQEDEFAESGHGPGKNADTALGYDHLSDEMIF